jgi:POT family proton-dependent oligopeptide transporter
MKADDDGEKPLLKNWLFLTIFALTGIVFATVFDQLGSSVTLLVQEHVRRVIGSFEFSAGYTQSINPLLVIMLGPVFALAMKHKIPNKLHLSRTTILVLGALFLGGGFAVLSLATLGVGVAGDRTTVSWIWVFLAIFLSTVGELMFAPIALSLVSGLGAARHQSFLVGAWTAVNGIGSYLSGTMAGIMESLGLFSLYLGISAVACWVVAILFWITSRTVYMSAIGKVAKIES